MVLLKVAFVVKATSKVAMETISKDVSALGRKFLLSSVGREVELWGDFYTLDMMLVVLKDGRILWMWINLGCRSYWMTLIGIAVEMKRGIAFRFGTMKQGRCRQTSVG